MKTRYNCGMTDEEKILKIEQVLKHINSLFSSFPKARITRNDWLEEHKIKKENWNDYIFSLSAEDIIQNKIPRAVGGCSGVAGVFVKLLKDNGLDSFIVATANSDDWEKAKKSDKNHEKRNIINGHQIVAVEFSDGLRA
ncbi:MAG: hypothetical protein LBF28_02895, partial [Rickettsiales bacterium]|nr:hypothetical protein [Rickettsiales bacterium]